MYLSTLIIANQFRDNFSCTSWKNIASQGRKISVNVNNMNARKEP